MSAPGLIAGMADAPPGAHVLGLHVSGEEAADQAATFLSAAPLGHATAYWVSDPAAVRACDERLARLAPGRVGSVVALSHEHVEFVDGRLRPAREVREFVEAHPEGLSAGAETISHYWSPATLPEHLEYESWLHGRPRAANRIFCAYDLRSVPVHLAPTVLRDLGSHHSHVTLSSSQDGPVLLLELFVFRTIEDLPSELLPLLDQAVESRLLDLRGRGGEFVLTLGGERLVQAWVDRWRPT